MNGYSISRQWWDFAFANPEKIKPIHSALLFFAMEHCNRLGWKEKFGLPSQMAMDAIGVSHYNTYSKAFADLVDWGFFIVIQKSKNQYSANIIALSKNDEAQDKALDKAMIKHSLKQGVSTIDIDKQVNNRTIEPKKNTFPSIEDVKDFFREKGYSQDTAVKAFEYYSINQWKDGNGKPVKNWKQKMIAVWFKPENLIKKTSTEYARLT